MRLSLHTGADLGAAMAKLGDGVAAGVTRAVQGTVRELTLEMRRRTIAGGLGRAVANAWRDDYYPQRGVSADAAGRVKSKAPKIIDAFDHAHVIRSEHGGWLAIPMPAAYYGGKPERDPKVWEQRVGLPLRFVYTGRSRAWLVADGARVSKKGAVFASGGGRAFGLAGFNKQRRTRLVVLVYELRPFVRTKKRIDLESAAAAAQADLAASVAVEVASVLIPDARKL